MSIVLFAMIGAMLKAKAAYWIVFGFYCAYRLLRYCVKLGKTIKENEKL